MKALLGQKVGMTRIADKHGRIVGATVIEATPNAVTAIMSTDKHGYSAIQLGYGDIEQAKKPQQAALKIANAKAGHHLIEIRTDATDEAPALGSDITVEIFKPGDIVDVTATSKGHGFAGTVKRHHFTIGPRSHGGMNQREPGSIGSQKPQRVVKGRRMAGHMGAKRATVKHLEVLDVLPDENLLVLKGAIPGIKGALVLVRVTPRFATSLTTETEESVE